MPEHAGDAADDELLAGQRHYYRRRAPEYDEWWQRRGPYDRGEDEAREWDRQVDRVAAALRAFGPAGDLLELAGGTGWWSARLAETASQLTIVDASPEALALNRERLGARPHVTYVVADLFEWRPERTYDAVFFSFWLSHVPRARVGDFWRLVGSCLAPGGGVFLIDNRFDLTVGRPDPYVAAERDDVQRRRLNDGSEHRVVKVFYEPEELAALLDGQGWDAQISGTRWFLYGSARPRA